MSPAFNGQLHDHFVFRGVSPRCGGAVGPDGRGLAGAAAHLQFRLGRTIWTFSLGLTGAAGAVWPIAGASPNLRQWLLATLVAVWSLRLGSHIALRTAGITDDPRYERNCALAGVPACSGTTR